MCGIAIIPFFVNTNSKDPDAESKPLANYNITSADSYEKLYHDALSVLIHPYIQKAIHDRNNTYSEYHGGTIDPWNTKILSVERIPGHTSWFLIKVEVMPYVLAHISVGRDHITLLLNPSGKVIIEKFERIENYDYQKW